MLQPLALNILKSGRNVFLTGQAGSGKTYVINQYIRRLRSCNIHVAVTASTGIAATHIGGVTIHSRSGIGIKDTLTPHDLELIQQKEHLHKQITKAKVLIIDEISMLSAQTLDMVDQVCQMMRRDGRAFGGLQVVLIGDFFQLPPVTPGGDSSKRFAFASKVRKQLDLVTCYLHTQHRQDAGQFTTILNHLRTGTIQQDHLTHLKTRLHKDVAHPRPVKLYTHNVDVDRINAEELAKIDSDMLTYAAVSTGDPLLVNALAKSMLAPQLLSLKIGAQVIFVKNNPTKGYYNGTTGTVVSVDQATTYPMVQLLDGTKIKVEPESRSIEHADQIVASVRQLPLKLARAITVHKSQGMTLDAAEMDLSQVFEPGQAYVALSRIRSLEGLKLLGLNESGLAAHPLVVRGDVYFAQQSELAQEQFQALDEDARETIHQHFITHIGGQYVRDIIEKEKIIIGQPRTRREKSTKPEKGESLTKTLTLIKEGKNLEEIAELRSLAPSTILQHIFKLKALHPDLSLKQFRPAPDILTRVRKAIEVLKTDPANITEQGMIKLSPIFNYLEGSVSYDEIRLCLLIMG